MRKVAMKQLFGDNDICTVKRKTKQQVPALNGPCWKREVRDDAYRSLELG